MPVDAGAQLPPVSTAARSMDYVIRMLIPFNFESFENKAVTLNIECSDIFGLKDITSISFNILDENDPPSSILSSKNYYKIEENANGGEVVIGSLAVDNAFEDDDVGETHTFAMYRAGSLKSKGSFDVT